MDCKMKPTEVAIRGESGARTRGRQEALEEGLVRRMLGLGRIDHLVRAEGIGRLGDGERLFEDLQDLGMVGHHRLPYRGWERGERKRSAMFRDDDGVVRDPLEIPCGEQVRGRVRISERVVVGPASAGDLELDDPFDQPSVTVDLVVPLGKGCLAGDPGLAVILGRGLEGAMGALLDSP